MSRSLELPALLGERKFPLPGSGSPRLRGVCPRHPHSTFFNIMFVVSLSLLDFSIAIQLRHSSFSRGHHSGNARDADTNALDQVRLYSGGHSPYCLFTSFTTAISCYCKNQMKSEAVHFSYPFACINSLP